MLNKPKGYVTTVSDEKKRPTVMDLVQKVKGRVYPVGRLDWASEGLLLMTNDGALANALMKASSNVPKTYVVKVAGQPDEAKLDKLRRGVSIAEKGGRRVRTAPAKIRLIREGDNPWLEVTIIEGRNRQVRKMFEEVGHHVEKIRRVQYGPLALDVPPGDWRNLTLLEVAKLKTAASGPKLTIPPSVPAGLCSDRSRRGSVKTSRAPRAACCAEVFSRSGDPSGLEGRRVLQDRACAEARQAPSAPARFDYQRHLMFCSAIIGSRAAPYSPASLPSSARVIIVLCPGPGFDVRGSALGGGQKDRPEQWRRTP